MDYKYINHKEELKHQLDGLKYAIDLQNGLDAFEYWDKESKFDHYTKREHITCSILYDNDSFLKLENEILDFYKAKKLKEAKTRFERCLLFSKNYYLLTL